MDAVARMITAIAITVFCAYTIEKGSPPIIPIIGIISISAIWKW